jgi:hypothetical protein
MRTTTEVYTVPSTFLNAALVTLDGLPLVVTDRPDAFLHAYQPQSVDYALEHGGYEVRRPGDGIVPTLDATDLRAAAAYLTIAHSPGAGRKVLAVRLIEQLRGLVDDGDAFPDYVLSGDVVEPLASAAIGALSCCDDRINALRGRLDGAVRRLARRGGLTEQEADAL